MIIKIGTRGSLLALTQTTYVKERLQKAYPMHTFEIQVIKTMGDIIVDRPISSIGNKGIFVKEIEEKILSDEIQLGVHSMKDMPADPANGLKYTKAWKREDARDVLILNHVKHLEELKEGAVIGTGSLRRRSQLLKIRKDLSFVDIRGNVETRIRKMKEQNLDGIVLAAAGLNRLGKQDEVSQYLSFEEMVPAPAQGVLALEIKNDNVALEEMLNALSDVESDYEAKAERSFLKEIDGDCTIPVGAVCEPSKYGHRIYASFFKRNTDEMAQVMLEALEDENPKMLAIRAAKEIRKKISGIVSLVGAGPGDEKLITVKGKEAIQEADCILYDRLSSPNLLSYAKENCEKIYVGKANHNHTYKQDEINQMLIQKAMEYKKVVRLKGGDVYVFGRGSEEALALKQAGVSFEIVPGVSSAIAGLAYAGIPITSRGVSRGFSVVTAKDKRDELAKIDFSSMLKKDHTYVFLMGLTSLEQIADGFMNAGKPKSTKAAVISNATLPNQKVVISTLDRIAKDTKEAKLPSPALIVVGDVISFAEELNFFEMKPLFQKKCMVPYIGEGQSKLGEELEKLGAMVSPVQVGTVSRVDITFDNNTCFNKNWFIFTSKNGIDSFFRQAKEQKIDFRNFRDIKFAVIGDKTKEYLAEYGFYADFIPSKANTTCFVNEFQTIVDRRDHVVLIKVLEFEHEMCEQLNQYCDCVELFSYKNQEVELKQDKNEWIDTDYIFFTCASSVERVCACFTKEELLKLQEKGTIVSIGPKCSKMLEKYHITKIIEAKESSYQGMIEQVVGQKYN